MKLNSKNILLISLIFTFCACQPNQKKVKVQEEETPKELFKIDPRTFENIELNLSDIATDIEYIPLNNNFKIGTIGDVKFTENEIYIQPYEPPNSVLLKFDRQGKNPISIGKIGRGPGEYLWCAYFAVNSVDNRVYIHGKVNTIMVFNTNGKYIYEFKLPLPNNKRGFKQMEILGKKYLFFAQNSIGAEAEYNWIITDSLGNVISSKFNTTPPFKTRTGMGGGIFKYNDKIYYWVDYNDTIFSISSDLNYNPSYIIEPGTHRRPKKEEKFTSLEQYYNRGNLYSPIQFIETNQFLISRYRFKGEHAYTFINKINGKSFVNHYIVDKDLKVGGVINNFDGGLMFRPINYYSKGSNEFLIGFILPFQLKAHVSSKDFKNSTPKFPEKKKQLEKLANSLNENDNPVLMLVKLKK